MYCGWHGGGVVWGFLRPHQIQTWHLYGICRLQSAEAAGYLHAAASAHTACSPFARRRLATRLAARRLPARVCLALAAAPLQLLDAETHARQLPVLSGRF